MAKINVNFFGTNVDYFQDAFFGSASDAIANVTKTDLELSPGLRETRYVQLETGNVTRVRYLEGTTEVIGVYFEESDGTGVAVWSGDFTVDEFNNAMDIWIAADPAAIYALIATRGFDIDAQGSSIGYEETIGSYIPTANAFTGSDFGDLFEAGSFADVLSGGVGMDSLHGNEGDDTLSGGNGTDLLEGGDDDDVLYGGKGADTLKGGQGTDTIFGEIGSDLIKGGRGFDHLFGDDGSDTIHGGGGSDYIEGGTGHDFLRGGLGKDTILGGKGNDEIVGGSGDDLVYGEDGNDSIEGNNGGDILIGGAGDDTLTGGKGIDAFVFFEDAGGNVVTDFDTTSGANDVVFIAGVAAATSFAQLKTDGYLYQDGSDVILDMVNSTMTLENILLTDMSDAMFQFA